MLNLIVNEDVSLIRINFIGVQGVNKITKRFLLNMNITCFILRNFEHLIPDAPELIHDFLVNEKDASCKRNAFMMLIHADQVMNFLKSTFRTVFK